MKRRPNIQISEMTTREFETRCQLQSHDASQSQSVPSQVTLLVKKNSDICEVAFCMITKTLKKVHCILGSKGFMGTKVRYQRFVHMNSPRIYSIYHKCVKP